MPIITIESRMMRPFGADWTYTRQKRGIIMNVNGITSTTSSYDSSAKSKVSEKTAAESTSTKNTAEDTGVVYETSKKEATDSVKKTYKPDKNLIEKLKAETDARTQQLRDLVEKMLNQQVNTYGKANDIWQFLREGNFTVDPATKAQAQADIAEDGYWGVEQTSDRIVQFATALTGGDPDKIEEMRAAFQKGFKQAEQTWGGELPEISQKTYEAVMEKFDKLAAEAAPGTEA